MENHLEPVSDRPLSGQVVLVTGGTRGIGKAIALAAARAGAAVAVTYRDPAKLNRAEKTLQELETAGVPALLVQADVTEPDSRRDLYRAVRSRFGRLDGLVLNAAGGLEAGKGPDYARLINRDAQLALVEEALAAGLMPPGSLVIYMTSLWAHRWGQMEPLPGYAVVAETKFQAEHDLRAMQPQLETAGVRLAVVVGHLITDTGAFAVFKRMDKTIVEKLAEEVEGGLLPGPDDVARATIALLHNRALPGGHTVFVGQPLDQGS